MNVMQRVGRLLGRGKPERSVAIALPTERPTASHRRYLSVMTMVRNEALDLREWLVFQQVVGVEHVYIYDDGSTDGTVAVLDPFVQSGFATVIPWSGFCGEHPDKQYLAYAHAIATFGHEWRWMAFIDRDEYLFPVQGGSLADAMRPYEDLPAIVVPWVMYGSCGHETRPDGLVIQNYTKRMPFPPPPVTAGLLKWKSIVDPSAVTGIGTAHFFHLSTGEIGGYTEQRHWVDRIPGGWHHTTAHVLRINHYFSQSKEDFVRRRFSTRKDTDRMLKRSSRLAHEVDAASDVDDTGILQYVPEMTRRLA